MDAIYLHAGLIAVLAVIQSVFGMGILVFGTPTLLLLGFDFTVVLGLLLPASMTISIIQVHAARQIAWLRQDKINMGVCAVAIVAALSLLILLNWKAHIELWLGITMLAAAALRYWRALQERLRTVLDRQQSVYVAVMGVLHGLTNMGGALLALYATSVHKDKHVVRATIARYYLLFGAIQLSTLALLKPASLSLNGLLVAPIAAVAYFVVGNVLFTRASAPLFDRSITAFIAVYGVAVLAKAHLL
ncbi:hypothetical protein IGB42_01814 [Andreprevotia sp. IGB-42]|uniref:TSUP family transporter n=1 Tax=Andreprevotia sp. IGB-42 TaxID=2497473 RepID=UPI001358E92B|nr:TSUP family transporter [Andreprevotia sp. IGB-42]KAF0813463.1 hypothetical protein IGB42_01814 [Andreprevotia sp. IGB-42]